MQIVAEYFWLSNRPKTSKVHQQKSLVSKMLYPLTLILSPKYRDWNFSHSVRPNYISVEWGVVQGSHASDWLKSIPWPISARPGSHTADWIKSITWPLPIRPESHACCWLDEINHVTSSGWTYLNMYTVYSAYNVQCTVSTDSRSSVVWSMLPAFSSHFHSFLQHFPTSQ